MKNEDINSRFNDWLLSPAETLDFEVKGWVDLSDVEGRAVVAKALIALENHGGGFLLFGYTEDASKQLVPDPARPASLELYLPDSLNGIIRKFAEPPFHVDVSLQAHPETAEKFPLVLVSGFTKVPIRSARETPKSTIRINQYYIRRPGPSSEPPVSGAEWEKLIGRCLRLGREEIISILRDFLPLSPAMSPAGTGPAEPADGTCAITVDNWSEAPKDGAAQAGMVPMKITDGFHELIKFSDDCFNDWTALNEGLGVGHPAKIQFGSYSLSCQFRGRSKGLKPKAILDAVQGLSRYTGWPVLIALHNEGRPYPAKGCIEAFLAPHLKSMVDVGHADFWRVCPEGMVYLLRGLQEDALERSDRPRPPGKCFDLTLPVWRVGEFLLRVEELGRAMYEEPFELVVRCQWRGIAGRDLTVLSGMRMLFDGHKSQDDEVETRGVFSNAAISDDLPDVVKQLTEPLLISFDFFEPPASLYAEELERMRSRRV